MKNATYKAKLFEMIISGKGLQYVMDACSELLGNPFVFANQSLQLVCKCSSCNDYPKVFDWIENYSDEKLRIAQEANNAGYFRDIYESDSPVYGTISGISANWIAARVRLKDQILGNILVSDSQKTFTEEYQELLPLVCQTIAFALQQSGKQDNGRHNYAPLLIELLDGHSDSHLEEVAIRAQFELLGQKLPQTIRVLIVRPSRVGYVGSRGVLDAQLRSQFPASFGIIYKNDCVRILDGKLPREDIEERLFKYIHTTNTICGISRVLTSVLSIHDAYQQADAAVRLSKNSSNHVLTCFDDVAGPYLLEQVEEANNISVEGMILSEITVLLGTKAGLGFERLQDLAAYLSSGRNVTRAAELRQVHKNSMYYRLDRITELTNLNLNDDDTCIYLTMSLVLLGILPFRQSYHII